MRIIAGEFSSRQIKTLKGNATRPTLDKVREAVFSSLGGFFDGGNFLDLYAGSGAVSFEALSRGMDKAILVDKSREAISIIKQNIDLLNVKNRTKTYCMPDTKALSILKEEGIQFDLVYLDPPYAYEHNEEIIHLLHEYNLLNKNARIVVECLKEDSHSEDIDGIRIYKEAVYGITRIVYYRNEN